MEKNNLKLYIISGVFAVALLVLYILHFTGRPSVEQWKHAHFSAMQTDSVITLPIAFVNYDSLLINYHFAQDLNDRLMTREESIRATLTDRERQVINAINDFEHRSRNNAFLSREREQQAIQQIERMQQEAQQLEQRLIQDFQLEHMRLSMRMEDTIRVRVNQFNAIRGFEVIFGTVGSSTILYANQKYDITQELIEFLNRSYDYATYWAE